MSVAETQEPGALGLAMAGAPGSERADSETAGPVAAGPGEAGGRGGQRTAAEETSSWAGRATGPGAALLAWASRSRFSRSSSDTVLGLGRGPHGAGRGAGGGSRQACSPLPPRGLALFFVASPAGTLLERQPEGGQHTAVRPRHLARRPLEAAAAGREQEPGLWPRGSRVLGTSRILKPLPAPLALPLRTQILAQPCWCGGCVTAGEAKGLTCDAPKPARLSSLSRDPNKTLVRGRGHAAPAWDRSGSLPTGQNHQEKGRGSTWGVLGA